MNFRLQNPLNMVGARVTVARSPASNGKQSADFGSDLAQLAIDYGSVSAKAVDEI